MNHRSPSSRAACIFGIFLLTCIFIIPSAGATVMADAGQDQAVEVGTNVTVRGRADTGNLSIMSWTWDLYHGTAPVATYHVQDMTFTAILNGTYRAVLTVVDGEGARGTDECLVFVGDFDGGSLTADDQDDGGLVPDILVQEVYGLSCSSMCCGGLLAVVVLVVIGWMRRRPSRR